MILPMYGELVKCLLAILKQKNTLHSMLRI